MRKFSIYLAIFMLIVQLFPSYINAETIASNEENENEVTLFSIEIDGEIELYEDDEGKTLLTLIPDDTNVQLLEDLENIDENREFSLIEYTPENAIDDSDAENTIVIGYVHNDLIVHKEDVDSFRKERLEASHFDVPGEEESVEEQKSEESGTYEVKPEEKEEPVKGEEQDKPVKAGQNSPKVDKSKDNKAVLSSAVTTPQSLTGYALKQPVSVYAGEDRNTEVLKSYPYGHLLKFQVYSEEWYTATVYINGDSHSGYIHVSDVGELDQISSVTGVALKQPTAVYSKTAKSSAVLRTYQQGQILKYRQYDVNWFIATVYINGKAQTGYIHVNDVETATTTQTSLQGVGIKSPTKIYATASTGSTALKTYNYGQILKYRTFTTDWYVATVYVNGKAHTGYIHKNDVGSMNTSLTGYGQKSPTSIYSSKSKSSSVLKSYAIGTVLKYRPHNNDWYEATVMYNGKWTTGYIHAKDVGANAPTLSGYAHANPTQIYSSPSKSSASLKSYAIGSNLKYRPYNNDWYIATIYISGKKHTGYIHKNDVGESQPSFTGYAVASPTTVYAKTSKSSQKLRSYQKGSKLKLKHHNANWYVVTVSVNGKWTTGYIHKNDIGDATNLSIVNPRKTYTYNQMIADIKSLAEAYPDLISYKVVGKSEYGRNLYAVSLGNGKATTFINGSLHAREWITTSLNMYMLESYAKAYRENKSIDGFNARKILNETTIWFMPMVNPDGVTLQQQGLSAFPTKDHAALIRMNGGSKDFKRWKANAKGVDLNRNFSVDWYTITNNVSYPNHQNHKGNAPASARETQAVINFVREINPQMTINYHSSGEILYWGYNQKGANYTRDYNYARAIGKMTGYYLMPYSGYPSGGGFLQYFTETYKRPSLTPELSPYVGNTNVPVSTFTRIWGQNKAVGLYAAQESAKLYKK